MNYKKLRLVLVLFYSFLIFTYSVTAQEIWISPTGNDFDSGSKEEPLATLNMALRKARELRRLNDKSIEGGIFIIVEGGTYTLNSPILIRPEDSGTPSSPTIIKAAEGVRPIFSGGIKISNWEKVSADLPNLPHKAKGKIWETSIPFDEGNYLNFRQLWVNGKKAVRANTLNDGKLSRILSVDKEKQEMWIPTPPVQFHDVDQLEFTIHQWWAIADLRVKSIDIEGEKTKLTFRQPESQIEFEHPWPAPFIDEKNEYNGNSAFYFSGSVELLNSPGEWFADFKTGKIYYWPRENETMDNAEVVAPFLENLVKINGTLDEPVHDIDFQNITFEHSTWLRPSQNGHVPLQAGFYILDAYKLEEPGTPDKAGLENQAWLGRQPAAVTVNNAENLNFSGCLFQHLAATGLDFVSGVHHSTVEGNVFNDIAGTGFQAGFFGSEAFEAHKPYDPLDGRELVHHIEIDNNYINDVTNEDWGCTGISVGVAHDITIEHNEIYDVNYSGICVGWSWTKTISALKNNTIKGNEIHHFAKQMYDVGGIYTLSAQPNTLIAENSIYDLEKAPYAHIPKHYQYIYFDEGSSYIRAIDNWTEKDKFFSNSPGPGNEWKNNGPQVSKEIKQKAGIQPEFKDIKSLID